MTTEQANERVIDVVEPLVNDVNESLKYLLLDEHTQFWRRTHIRAILSLLEGWMYIIRQVALSRTAAGLCELASGDIALLTESSFEVDKHGDLLVQPKFIPTDKMVRFVFRCLATALGADYKLDTSTTGWNAFKTTLAVRNRITHPRLIVDLTITDDEMKAAEAMMEWFRAVTLEPFHAPQRTPNPR